MQALRKLSFIRTFFQRAKKTSPSLSRQGVSAQSLNDLTPFYERNLPWWSRYTYTLVGLNVIISVSAFELTLRHWTQLEDPSSPTEDSKSTSESAPTAENEQSQQPRYVLRPLWHRLPFACGHLAVGFFIANMLLTTRSRLVRRIYVIPPKIPQDTPLPEAVRTVKTNFRNAPSSSSTKTSPATSPPAKSLLVIQSAKHISSQGRVVPLNACSIVGGKENDAVRIKVPGIRGMFYVGLDSAKIEGESKGMKDVGDAMYGLFGRRFRRVLDPDVRDLKALNA
ncbi:unnamed protein product [Somion occarium]